MNNLIILALSLFLSAALFVTDAAAGEFLKRQAALPQTTQETYDTVPLLLVTQAGDEHIFQVEIADERVEWRQGLMYRTKMAQDHGMLFIFPQAREQGFWMRNTLIPLDMLFIDTKGQIIKIHENAVPHDETRIRSGHPALAVLELNAGTVARLGLQEGDQLIYSAFAPTRTKTQE